MFQADLKQRAHGKNQVRRSRSDLGGQRLFNWEQPKFYRKMISSPAPIRSRPQSPKKKPPNAPGDVVLRPSIYRRSGQLRRSLSQPLDIDKLSPLMRVKTAGKFFCFINKFYLLPYSMYCLVLIFVKDQTSCSQTTFRAIKVHNCHHLDLFHYTVTSSESMI